MTLFGSNFEVNSSIDKLRDLLGHFDKKEMADFIKYYGSMCSLPEITQNNLYTILTLVYTGI